MRGGQVSTVPVLGHAYLDTWELDDGVTRDSNHSREAALAASGRSLARPGGGWRRALGHAARRTLAGDRTEPGVGGTQADEFDRGRGPAPARGHFADDPAAGVDPRVRVGRPVRDGLRLPQDAGRSTSGLGSRRARCWPRSTCRATPRRSRRRRRWSSRRGRRSSRPRPGSRWPRRSGTPRPPRSRRLNRDLDRLVARRELAEKQYQRVSGLVAERAATRLLADEQQRDLEAATAAERIRLAWRSTNAKAKLLAAEAAVEQAKADAAEARANLGVAEARLETGEGQPGLRQDRRALRRSRDPPRRFTRGPSFAPPPREASSNRC